MRIKIYVEGGGKQKSLNTRCRKAFSDFFQRAGFEGRMPAVVACGARDQAYSRFCNSLKVDQADTFSMLLVDSEDPVRSGDNAWDHLKRRDGWMRPANCSSDQAQLMIQCMESWFLADKAALKDFYGYEFHAKALPASSNIESIPRQEVLDGLGNATRHCTTKGQYHKGRHSFEILGQVDSTLVRAVANGAEALLMTLEAKLPFS